MLALRLVVDTNVLVSAALKPKGLQRTVFLLAIKKPARLFVSPSILEEYRDVLARPELKIQRFEATTLAVSQEPRSHRGPLSSSSDHNRPR